MQKVRSSLRRNQYTARSLDSIRSPHRPTPSDSYTFTLSAPHSYALRCVISSPLVHKAIRPRPPGPPSARQPGCANPPLSAPLCRYKFTLSAPHKRIAAARHGIINAIREVFNRNNIYFTELRLHASLPYGPVGAEAGRAGAGAGTDPVASAAAAMAAGAVPWGGGCAAAPGAAMPAALEGPYGGGMGMPYGGGVYGMYGGGPVK